MSAESNSKPKPGPCPFCPYPTERYYAIRDVGWQHDCETSRRLVVVCSSCGAQGPAFGVMSFSDESTAAQYWNSRFGSSEPRHYFCSCGGALTAEEYINHYFELGHDRGDPAFSGPAPVSGSTAPVVDEMGLNLLRQLVGGKNSLRVLGVFSCNQAEHEDVDCKCFWEQCEAWAKQDATARADRPRAIFDAGFSAASPEVQVSPDDEACSFCEHPASDHARGQLRRAEPCEHPDCTCGNYQNAVKRPSAINTLRESRQDISASPVQASPDEPDIFDLVARYRDTAPVCVHCELPIMQEKDKWIHAGSSLVTCRRSGLAKHDGVFRATPIGTPVQASVSSIVTENLKSIIVRCEEGDPKADWLPIIARLAREALNRINTQASVPAEGEDKDA